MVNRPDSNKARSQRHKRVRGKINGTAERPRLNVFRSLQNIYAQLIDDVNGVTLVSASSVEKDFEEYGGNKSAARKVGEMLAKRAIEKDITDVVFDRGGYIYHGRVQELAEGAREGGLKF
ncbi:MAG: 50S ribosomal protein L18 [Clostridia bacterium]|nr:50S ribosomal protein L18 [Clostridia bacterium]MBQ2828311.1 50S ribosomal protein L18 [Clostridia bacterium]MBQ7957803.1 50S ribosomal protein L18 [Clostridia bacterium]